MILASPIRCTSVAVQSEFQCVWPPKSYFLNKVMFLIHNGQGPDIDLNYGYPPNTGRLLKTQNSTVVFLQQLNYGITPKMFLTVLGIAHHMMIGLLLGG